jgi:hypothetical protein
LSPVDVRDLYLEQRNELRGENYRYKEVGEDALRLAVFVAERCPDAEVWADLEHAWKKLGGRSYANFTTAARKAYERVTGTPLQWAERRGASAPQLVTPPTTDKQGDTNG